MGEELEAQLKGDFRHPIFTLAFVFEEKGYACESFRAIDDGRVGKLINRAYADFGSPYRAVDIPDPWLVRWGMAKQVS
jgi:hypothetical protein